jgi:hypothetical protein
VTGGALRPRDYGADTAELRAEVSVRFAGEQPKSSPSACGQDRSFPSSPFPLLDAAPQTGCSFEERALPLEILLELRKYPAMKVVTYQERQWHRR